MKLSEASSSQVDIIEGVQYLQNLLLEDGGESKSAILVHFLLKNRRSESTKQVWIDGYPWWKTYSETNISGDKRFAGQYGTVSGELVVCARKIECIIKQKKICQKG